MLLAADTVVTPRRVLSPGWVETSGPVIRTVGEGEPPGTPHHDLGDAVLAPGFVDMHAHGGGGASFMDGPAAARTALATHRAHGTTTMVASLVTDTIDRLADVCASLAPLAAAGEIAGIHLEGPWLSGQHCGAHDPALLRDPDLADVDRLLQAADGHVVMVTLAPERPGGIDAVRHLTAAGVAAAIGHSDATYAQAREALLAGARVATHLYNAMRPLHHREPGIAGAAISDGDVYVETIADGIHLHPAVVRQVLATAERRAVLVTDAMAAAGAPDGRYRLGPLDVDVVDGVARLVEGGAIAGSTLTLDAAVRYAVTEAGVPVADAVRAATLAPARVLRLDDRGRIKPGCRADLVALGPDLHVRAVLDAGEWVVAP